MNSEQAPDAFSGCRGLSLRAGSAALGSAPVADAVEERLRLIVGWLGAEGRLRVTDLTARLDVTAETVRRDLSRLEKRGALRRVHGGALPVPAPQPFAAAPPPTDRYSELARRTWDLLPHRGSIVLGAGLLSEALANVIAAETAPLDELTIITVSISAAITCAARHDVSVHNPGGQVDDRTYGQFGPWTLDSLRRIHADVTVSCPDGVTAAGGLSRQTAMAAEIATAELTAGRRRVVIAGRSTIGTDALVSYAGLREIDVIVTDASAEHTGVDELIRAGARVLTVPTGSSQ